MNAAELEKKIRRLELESSRLDTPTDEYERWLGATQVFASDYLASLPDQPAFSPDPNAARFLEPIPEQPERFGWVLKELQIGVLNRGLNAASGRYMAYVPGGGIPAAAIADFLAALSNRYSGNYGACPPAAEIENVCVRWLIEMVGLPSESWGTLTTGGTLAALTALVAARDTREAARWRKGVIYQTTQCHHSIAKVFSTIGLAHVPFRLVPVDGNFRMDPAALSQLIEADKRQGLEPWIICATAGTTNSGAVDPLPELSQIAKAQGLWLHVDGAYGGFFILTAGAGPQLRAMALADSLVLDPHKSLFLPYGCGAVLVRDGALLRRSFSHTPDYLKDLHYQSELSPSDFSIEGTRHFRGLRMWLSIKLNGLERFRKALEEKLLLAHYAYERLYGMQSIELGPPPQLSCVTFRVRGDSEAQSEARTEEVLQQIHKRGVFYNSSTRLNGRLYQRLCILSFRTHLREVDMALAEIEALSSAANS